MHDAKAKPMEASKDNVLHLHQQPQRSRAAVVTTVSELSAQKTSDSILGWQK